MSEEAQPQNTAPSFPIVGLGASAGGLRALEDFFDHLPADSGAAYVVIQHLSPDFKSLMKELLKKHTDMSVEQATDGMRLTPDSIFLIPPGQSLRLEKGMLRLTAQDRAAGQPLHFPINLFFQSLAVESKESAIAIVLSGTGSDGTLGIRHIAEGGGIVMVQDPTTAEFDGMPKSVIATGLTDLVLPTNEIAKLTYQFITLPNERKALQQNALNPTQLDRILVILKRYEHIDFTQYKTSTITRQVTRRCLVSGNVSLEQYIEKLENFEEERQALRNDLLITVTHFFRNPEAWQYLQDQILPEIINNASVKKPIRIWVTACATGEEAYSMAILLHELMTPEQLDTIEVKIFATDVDPIALKKASLGLYPEEAMISLSASHLGQFFVAKDDGFEVSRSVRKMVIFANHNLTKDAGFTQIDLVTCRNVLIYMKPELQQRVLRNLHFSLKQYGTLFLGESENLGELGEEFKLLQRQWKIYQKIRDVRLPPFVQSKQILSASQMRQKVNVLTNNGPRFDPLLETAFKALLKDRQVTCLLVNRDNQLMHVCGDALNLLRIASGRVSQDIFRMLPSSLHLPLSTALHRARQTEVKVSYSECRIEDKDYEVDRVSLEVTKQRNTTAGSFLMVVIEASKLPQTIDLSDKFASDQETSQYILQLQRELQANRENLQATVEELEVINEEQQATNEELTASNEELQSTNEELHSVNEELYTVNAEYQSKIQELTELNDDLDNLIDNIDIGVIYLDNTLRIRKFKPAATLAFNLVEADIGRPLDHLSHNLESIDISEVLDQAQKQKTRVERDVKVKNDGPYLLLQAFPYTKGNKISDGCILTLVNVNEIQRTQAQLTEATQKLYEANEELEQQVRDRTQELKSSQQLLQSITQSTPNGIYIYDLVERRNIYANSFLERLLGYSPQELQEMGKEINQHLVHPDDLASLIDYHDSIIEALPVDDHHVFEIEYRVRDADSNWRDFYSQDTVFTRDENGRARQILGTAIDVSDRKANSIRLKESEARYRQLYQNTPAMMHSIDLEGNVLSASDNWLKRLGYTEQEVINQPIANLIKNALPNQDLVDTESENDAPPPPWMNPAGCEGFECQFVCKSGELMDVQLSTVADKDAEDNVKCLLTVLIDMTEQNKAKKEIKRYREHLEELVASRAAELKETNERLTNEVRDRIQAQQELDKRAQSLERSNADLEQFAYVVSHDLQEPLRAMTVFSQLLQQRYRTELDTTASEYIENIVAGGIRMQALIDGILDFSRVSHRGQSLKVVAVEPLVQTILSSLRTTLIENNATVTTANLPVITADYNQISQLFQNLISNAIKFRTPEAPVIYISAQASPAPHRPNQWLFSVKDNGIGIPDSQQKRIFSLFQRLHTRQELEGYGIGLAICKKIIERHNGRIWVESQPAEGATFYFTLDAQPSADAETDIEINIETNIETKES